MDLTKILKGDDSDKRGRKATDLLEEDHDKVRGLFKEYRDAKESSDTRAKTRLFAQIDRELSVHALVEEEIFYPAVKNADEEEAEDQVLEANEEHAIVKTLLAQLRQLDTRDETFDAKMKVLMEAVEHHADEEEKEMFPTAEELGSDEMTRLGGEIESRKRELEGMSPESMSGSRGKGGSRSSRRSTSRSSSGRGTSSRKTSSRKTSSGAGQRSSGARSTAQRSSKKSSAKKSSRGSRGSSSRSGSKKGAGSRSTSKTAR